MNNIDEKINKINLRAFSKKEIARFYSEESLQKTEEVILDSIKPKILNKKILEIGVGGGKTIEHLTKISKDYTGIDYSYEMVKTCKQRYPDANVINLDARDMLIFASNEFDFILCAFNGMDYVIHNDRLKILREVFRVLKKGGYFMFSTHNKNSTAFKRYISILSPFFTNNPFKTFTYNPSILSMRLLNLFVGMINHIRNSRYTIHTDRYSIINDKAHNYSLMTYYISIDEQKKQLYDVGFSDPIMAYDRYGREIADDCNDTWIYYLAKK